MIFNLKEMNTGFLEHKDNLSNKTFKEFIVDCWNNFGVHHGVFSVTTGEPLGVFNEEDEYINNNPEGKLVVKNYSWSIVIVGFSEEKVKIEISDEYDKVIETSYIKSVLI